MNTTKPIKSVKDIRPGLRFGWLETIRETETKRKGAPVWECKCRRCGKLTEVSASRLVYDKYVSCGCYKHDNAASVSEHLHFVDGTCVEWIEKRKARSDNTSGFRGVTRIRSGRWTAAIGFQGKRYHLGTFSDFDEAVKARLDAEDRLFKPFLDKYYAEAEAEKAAEITDS